MYVVIELQTNDNKVSTLTYAFDTMAEAEQKYYQILSFAVVSTVEVHACVLMTHDGFVQKNEVYYHPKNNE
jgi:hypothetical protein